MLDELTLRGFQSHAKLKIKLDAHVSTVLGASDRGKSAIVRALRWLATNKPGGDAFVKHGDDFTKVSAKVDGQTIRRTRGKGRNSYHLNGVAFKAFGSDVPEPIAKLLNVSEVNFQGQHDAPFWFSDSAGSVSRSLNAIVNLGVIDDTLTALAGKQREAVATLKLAEERSTAALSQWEDVKPAKRLDQELQEVEQLAATARDLSNRTAALSQLVQDGWEWGERATRAAKLLGAGGEAILAGERWAERLGDVSRLRELLDEYSGADRRAGAIVPDVSRLEALDQEQAAARSRDATLAALVNEVERLDAEQERARVMLKKTEERFHKELGERCPLCERKI